MKLAMRLGVLGGALAAGLLLWLLVRAIGILPAPTPEITDPVERRLAEKAVERALAKLDWSGVNRVGLLPFSGKDPAAVFALLRDRIRSGVDVEELTQPARARRVREMLKPRAGQPPLILPFFLTRQLNFLADQAPAAAKTGDWVLPDTVLTADWQPRPLDQPQLVLSVVRLRDRKVERIAAVVELSLGERLSLRIREWPVGWRLIGWAFLVAGLPVFTPFLVRRAKRADDNRASFLLVAAYCLADILIGVILFHGLLAGTVGAVFLLGLLVLACVYTVWMLERVAAIV